MYGAKLLFTSGQQWLATTCPKSRQCWHNGAPCSRQKPPVETLPSPDLGVPGAPLLPAMAPDPWPAPHAPPVRAQEGTGAATAGRNPPKHGRSGSKSCGNNTHFALTRVLLSEKGGGGVHHDMAVVLLSGHPFAMQLCDAYMTH